MARAAGTYHITQTTDEKVRAFVPHPLPPKDPPLRLDDGTTRLLAEAMSALGRLAVAGVMVPSANWFLYGFVQREAVISSQIEGTQATLKDVLRFEATQKADRPDDVEEVCNYAEALTYARREITRPKGLPLSTRLLCEVHKRLTRGVRGADKQPGIIRTTQNWIGGTRPGNARFVPPPPDVVPKAMSALEKWIHADDPLPPLVRAGLAHVQFEMIHPFLDGNGRIGRMLITLLVERWGLLPSPLLYLSLAFKQRREEYYDYLSAVHEDGDWESWIEFFLDSVWDAAEDGVTMAQRLFARLNKDRQALLGLRGTTVPAVRLFDQLPRYPFVTLSRVMSLVKTTKPTASKVIATLIKAGILREITGKLRDRVYAYHEYLELLTQDTD